MAVVISLSAMIRTCSTHGQTEQVQATVPAVAVPPTLSINKKPFSFGHEGLPAIVDGPPEMHICLNPRPDKGNYQYILSSGHVWAPGNTERTGTATFVAPIGEHRTIAGWLALHCDPK